MRARLIVAVALCALAFLGGLLLGRRWGRGDVEVVVERDTLTFHDTLVVDNPVPVYVTKVRTDTVRLALVDTSCTVVTRDYARVEVPITRKVYEDSTYRAVISGYNANLDSIMVRSTIREIYVVRTLKTGQKHWGLGVTAGPGLLVTPNGAVKGGVGVAAGLTYRF